MHKLIAAAAAIALAAPVAQAEVKSATEVGFEAETKVIVPATPAATYAALSRIGDWWNPEHSYSGKAANLRLEPRAGGCFCEVVDGGGTIEHMRVVYAQPGQVLRLQGGLGPLQAEGASGSLTWSFKAVSGGTEVTQSYVVGGYIRGGAAKLAGPVDQVMAGQLKRFQARLVDKAGR